MGNIKLNVTPLWYCLIAKNNSLFKQATNCGFQFGQTVYLAFIDRKTSKSLWCHVTYCDLWFSIMRQRYWCNHSVFSRLCPLSLILQWYIDSGVKMISFFCTLAIYFFFFYVRILKFIHLEVIKHIVSYFIKTFCDF